MRKAARWFVRLAFTIVVLVAAGTLIPRPLFPSATAHQAQTTNRHILVLSNPIHTDIAVPLDDDTRERFGFLAAAGVPIDDPSVHYLVFGWGGRSFYLETPTWADLKPLPVLKALTVDQSVMHVDVAGSLSENSASIRRFDLDERGFDRLLTYIGSSFADDRPIRGAGYGNFDAFFEANGYFNALLGCNTWTAKALRESGLRTGWWNPLPRTLNASLQIFN